MDDKLNSQTRPKIGPGDYFNFFYFPNKDFKIIRPFISYYPDETNKKFIDYLDFDRIIPLPSDLEFKNFTQWSLKNWGVANQSLGGIISEEGMFLKSSGGNITLLIKTLSNIIKQKIHLLYYDFGEGIGGEYWTNPGEDAIHIVHQNFLETAPETLRSLFREKLGVHICSGGGCSEDPEDTEEKS
jgi:hypothetical protein